MTDAHEDDVVALRDVTKSYGRKRVVHGVSLTMRRGEVVGFVGPNGAGKTTLLRLFVGLAFRDGGSLRVLGHDPDVDSLPIRQRCCYLPGETSVYQQLRGGQFLDFALSFYPRRHEDLLRAMLAAFDLPLERSVRAYSAGMKQKLALIANLVPDVDLYILDEPDRALDATARLQMRGFVRELAQRGKTILLSSHHLSEVEALARRLLFILGGRVVDDERVRAARDLLRRDLRLKMAPGLVPPPSIGEATQELDGTWRVRGHENPVQALASLDPTTVVAAEVGLTRLDALYALLTQEHATRAGEAP